MGLLGLMLGCLVLEGNKMKNSAHICFGGKVFDYDGYLFEMHPQLGPCPLSKCTHEPRKTIPSGFWKMIERFQKLTEFEKQLHEAT